MTTIPSGGSGVPGRVEAFDTLPRDEARARLLSCLAVPRWADEVLAGRPYAAWAPLQESAARAAGQLTDEELEAALARHPRIGERAGATHDAEHSRREQAGVDPGDLQLAARLAAGNAAYERRFDRVFLIRASGRSAPGILQELDRRLASTDEAERAEVITQLREIALLRLEEIVR